MKTHPPLPRNYTPVGDLYTRFIIDMDEIRDIIMWYVKKQKQEMYHNV